MPAYAARADIERIYGAQHLVRLVSADIADFDGAVADACLTASAEIDLYLGQRYALPLAFTPRVVAAWCVDLACWKLAPSAAQNTGELTKRAERVLAMLRDIAAGRAKVDELEPPPPAPGGAGGAIPAGGVGDAADGGAAFQSEPRRYGAGGLW